MQDRRGRPLLIFLREFDALKSRIDVCIHRSSLQFTTACILLQEWKVKRTFIDNMFNHAGTAICRLYFLIEWSIQVTLHRQYTLLRISADDQQGSVAARNRANSMQTEQSINKNTNIYINVNFRRHFSTCCIRTIWGGRLVAECRERCSPYQSSMSRSSLLLFSCLV